MSTRYITYANADDRTYPTVHDTLEKLLAAKLDPGCEVEVCVTDDGTVNVGWSTVGALAIPLDPNYGPDDLHLVSMDLHTMWTRVMALRNAEDLPFEDVRTPVYSALLATISASASLAAIGTKPGPS